MCGNYAWRWHGRGTQSFSPKIAGSNAALLVLALIGLFIPAVFALTNGDQAQGTITEESILVAVALMVGYVISLIYQFADPDRTLGGHGKPEGHAGPGWSGRVAIVVLIGAAALLASAVRPSRHPTIASAAGPRWRPVDPCRGTGRRSRPADPRPPPSMVGEAAAAAAPYHQGRPIRSHREET